MKIAAATSRSSENIVMDLGTSVGPRLLRNVRVRSAISAAAKPKLERLQFDADRVLHGAFDEPERRRALAQRATTHAQTELAEFSQEPLDDDDLPGFFGSEGAVQGLYSNLIPELSQPAFE